MKFFKKYEAFPIKLPERSGQQKIKYAGIFRRILELRSVWTIYTLLKIVRKRFSI